MFARLRGKTALITGASAGIGEACAYQFAAAGANVVLTARRLERLERVRDRIGEQWPAVQVHIAALDVCDRAAVDRVVAGIPAALGGVDVLVNNAGKALGLDAVDAVSDETIDGMIDTNVKGLLYVTRAVLPLMKQQPAGGHIIMLGSIAGVAGYAGGSVYCASKSAVRAISEALRAETNGIPVKVTEIRPGMVETEFSVVRFGGDAARADAVYRGIQPLVADDIAEMVVFAASRPAHCVVSEVVMLPKGQVGVGQVHRKEE
ncbi:hypothetical protein H4R18_000884 [Coemansia javaensis]|uniref:NAD(P)-binding protein n=1 Tax=Coemansia javaensis TaxID=2761396 RepID=A0A9W8HGW8_9FUNG|nr:hypothetical protein H4R18_000884 [Coemansia javaensis]